MYKENVNRKAKAPVVLPGVCLPRPLGESAKLRNSIAFVFSLLVFSFYLSGCGSKFFDPTQIGRFRPVPAVNVILDSLGVAEESRPAWEQAEEPRPIDLTAIKTDYVFGPGDVVRISIFELFQEGVAVTNDYVVTETGKISIPDVGIVEAAGLTESQLEEEIKQILTPSILKEPSVSVILMGSQQRTFSILGPGVPTPGRYAIPRYDFRLTDALATAGGMSQFNVSYIYVSRSVRGEEVITETVEPAEPEQLFEPGREALEVIEPRAGRQWPPLSQGLVIASAEMITDKELLKAASPEGFELLSDSEETGLRKALGQRFEQEFLRFAQNDRLADGRIDAEHILAGAELHSRETIDQRKKSRTDIEWVLRDDKWVPVQIGPPEPAKAAEPSGRKIIEQPINEQEKGRIEWVFRDGKWVPVRIGPPEPEKAAEPLKEKLPADWQEIGVAAAQTRVIKIPADRLLAGDPRYNVVIRPGDCIHVPLDIIGECCIMGNVNSPGYYNITGRPMTLKMAIAAAGGLGPLAWPKNCEVTRRIGEKKNYEETVMVDLDKIASGEQPDFFIKPNDLINVGTHPTSQWRYALRNAFRATYGFGFIYDRNFAYRDYYGTTYSPITPWKWEGVF